jgi:signal transduction histidine kinase
MEKLTDIRNTKEIRLNKFFAGVDTAFIDSLFQQEKFKEVNEGTIIYQTGDEADYLYLLLRGDVKIKFLPHNYISNKIFNDFFGEKEIFDKTGRNSSAVADSKCLLYLIDKSLLEDLVKKSPEVKKNIDLYGELDLPEMEIVIRESLNIANKDKPISFKATPPKQTEKDKEDNSNNNDEISNVISSIIREKNPMEGSNIFKDSEEDLAEPMDDDFNIELDDNFLLIEDEEPENQKYAEEADKEVEEENLYRGLDIKKIFKVINRFQVHSQLPITMQAIIDAAKELTSSSAGEIYLVNEDIDEMVKFVIENSSSKAIRYRSSEGLTGTCVLQKKIINFDNPSEDSRFEEEIDQPGNNDLKKIIYLPLINEVQKIVAVLQLARQEESYSDTDVNYLDMLKTPAAIAIERCKNFEKSVEEEKQKFYKNIEMFLTDNILIPLDLINRYSYIIDKEDFSQSTKVVMTMLQQQVNIVWDIVHSTLEINKTEFKLDIEEHNINSYINNISELLAEYCDSRNINFFKKTGSDAKVKIDRSKLFMAIYQIVRNACDFSVADSNVYISTGTDTDSVYIDIRDEGTGIADTIKEKIFTTGFSKDKGRNRIGLTITKKIIDAHNGQITFTSSTNKGTTFRISIPVYTSSE